jgi:hypothetical protein
MPGAMEMICSAVETCFLNLICLLGSSGTSANGRRKRSFLESERQTKRKEALEWLSLAAYALLFANLFFMREEFSRFIRELFGTAGH